MGKCAVEFVKLCLFVCKTDPWEKKTMDKDAVGGSTAGEPASKCQ